MSEQSPITADSIRDAAALITAVVHMNEPGERAILENCDHREVCVTLAAMFAMLMQVSSGCSDEVLADVVQEFAGKLASDISAMGHGRA